MSRSRKGQMFTVDMIASVLIFILIVNLSMMTWNIAQRNSVMFNEERSLRDRAAQISDILIRTPGHPEDWNADNVEIVGLAEPDHVMSEEKLEEFGAMPYSNQQEELRTRDADFFIRMTRGEGSRGDVIGNQAIALIVEESASPEDQEIYRHLNDSSMIWDLYWPSSEDEGELSSLTARSVYKHTTDSSAMFDDMLDNASEGAYNTVIAEDVALDTSNIEGETLLKEFVENGSSYVHTGEDSDILMQLFDIDRVSTGSENGVVKKVAPLLNNSLKPGDSVQFDDGRPSFTNVSTVFVEDSQEPYGCLACGWEIGDGNLYYVAETRGEDDNELITFTNPDESFGRFPLHEFGEEVEDDADTVAVSKRRVLVNDSNTGGYDNTVLELVLWR